MGTETFTPTAPLTTPVLLIVFNRPDTTKQVFEAIRKANPQNLFIAADGPRGERPEDKEKCAKVREIATAVDWNCEVKILFREKNLGCQRSVSGAINWFFENVEEGIVLEDDCLPSQSFFWYCQELLERYRNDNRIFVISGNNFQKGKKRTDYSYYFSCFNHCWGWATFKRAWKCFDFDMNQWPEIRNGKLIENFWQDKKTLKYWERIFKSSYENKINSWAYRWTFACWVQSGLTVLPNVNMVQNIGFGIDATHTTGNNDSLSLQAYDLNFPLNHPPFMIRDLQADKFAQKDHFANGSLLQKIARKGLRAVSLKK